MHRKFSREMAMRTFAALLTGVVSTPTWYDLTVSQSLQATPMDMLFHTDYSVTHRGFAIGRARVCCQSTHEPGAT